MVRILITGAAGSGTTTLGQYIAEQCHGEFLDADDYFWMPTLPPYQERRCRDERLAMIMQDASQFENTVISGSVMDWGRRLEDSFDIIVFLYLSTAIRVERLKRREMQLLGYIDQDFIVWASAYDSGPETGGRSLAKHTQWLSERTCPVIKLEGDLSVQQRADRVVNKINEQKN